MAGVASATLTVGALGLIALVISVWVYNAPGPAARQGGETTVVLRKGAGVSEIGAALERGGAIASAPLFMAAAQISGAAKGLKAGEYAFASRSSLSQVLSKIRRGDIVHHRVTVPEGLTSQQVVDILAKTAVLTGQVPTPPEGVLLPETYDVVRGEERSAVLQRMMDARDRLLGQLWAKRQAGLPFETPDQAVTLASIVEKETGVPAERPRVAAVYVNRLHQGMRLEADPTLIYGINGGRPLGRGLLQSELLMPGPYNTYLNAGLPPTPIGNPGRAALAAVLDPPQTREVFFVADGTGGHAFAETYEQHQKNVALWREIERTRPPGQTATHQEGTGPSGSALPTPSSGAGAAARGPSNR
ncbi:MAG TPA: endolytic transglycosylase MltG [Caulobacteraceae bacterium]|nr:endolytic transglycosylase MltG [Caulobacteraceae bacterium]